jgi:hypothetical protein
MLKPLNMVFAAVLLLFLVGPEFAQSVHGASVDTAWVKRNNGEVNSSDGGCAIVVDHFRHVYITGHSIGNGTYDDYLTAFFC